ncbi:Two component Transcriptional regulator, Winged helix family [Thiobacillus denitrificans ATCC 25259]|uniref:Two component Transcriptional regulator, Winged helix family n=1 Tax=Thiobacillus denitrificans (strain ATCC 25259 / T1) TaxID=292415 RepID=Q3SF71_THIDA|nr:response regulator [Thiobacillus denitrificans]AAZ98744.1 Two component Transcriptional regulator, Winged helix family [Thiobacillus denitrificans ATCC 25259]
MRVLLIEDDDLIAHGVQAGLGARGLTVDRVETAAQARTMLATVHYQLAILDLGLPDEDGMSLLQRWRAAGVDLPVLVLTARDAVEDRVAGLRAGADDYLLKPFDLDELLARLQALLRRAAGRSADVVEHGALRLDLERGDVSLNGRPVVLTRRELALLAALLHARGRILSADQLKDSLYGFSEEIESNALSVHIHHLRRKLGADLIETVRGLGYRFNMSDA